MKYIISGTDRLNSNTLRVSKYVQGVYKQLGEDVEVIDLCEVKKHIDGGPYYGNPNEGLQVYTQKIMHSDGLIVVCPEYNGSMPGALKYFIDHLKFPESFEYRPVCFIGVGAMFGGLRPVEHLQQVFGYRNAFIYPERVFMMNVWKSLSDSGEVIEPMQKQLLQQQAEGFQKFAHALATHKIDANSRLAAKT